MNERKTLLLEFDGLSNRAAAFFDKLDGDTVLQERFFDDPATLLSESTLFSLNGSRASQENSFIFRVLQNAELVAWAQKYARAVQPDTIGTSAERREWADALVLHSGNDAPLATRREHFANTHYLVIKESSHITTRVEKTRTETKSWFITKVADSTTRVDQSYLASAAGVVRSVVYSIFGSAKLAPGS